MFLFFSWRLLTLGPEVLENKGASKDGSETNLSISFPKITKFSYCVQKVSLDVTVTTALGFYKKGLEPKCYLAFLSCM